MHYSRLVFGISAAAGLALMVGCGSGGGSNGSNSSIESGFTQTLSDADQTVKQYAGSDDPAGDAASYHARETGHLDHMDDLWGQMHTACDDFAECPTGGGMSGDRDGNCMPDGHMMDDHQMNQMHDQIAAARAELEDYWSSCGESYDPATCENRRQQHAQDMHGIFGQMDGDCSEWWSQDDGHWGDCANHHDRGQHDGPVN